MDSLGKTNRLLSIDLARGLAVFFMISVHTLDVFANKEVIDSVFGQIISFFGGAPAAPVFMTLMGFSFVYSKKQNLKARLLHGFKIFLLGYALNILRGVMPLKLLQIYQFDIIKNFPLDKINEITVLTVVDILQFAGIALMIMAIIQKLKVKKYLILLLSVIILSISPLLWGLKSNILMIDYVLELFVGDQPILFSFINNKIAFPVFPWLSFPLLGMFLGETMKFSQNQNLTFKYFGIAGFVVLILGMMLTWQNPDYHFNDYYHSRQGAMIAMCGFVMLWIYLNELIILTLPMNKLFLLLFKWSIGVTNIYFVQWVIIIWSIALFGINDSSYLAIICLILTFVLISHVADNFILFLKSKF